MLRMKAGSVQVGFSKGARVVIEGPAEFQLMSDNEGRMVPLAPDACHFGCGD